ncbi:hypothetical protein CspHIS471_0307530 [Cutaneotrichosporon sp. HIS471]|nr:hypothetical protein CspHIS471_0307530 [Cutaneotrichosporon sp. HIS471]
MTTPSTAYEEDHKVEAKVDIQDVDDSAEGDLAHTPRTKRPLGVRLKEFGASLKSKEAWFADYDYGALFIPNIPGLFKKRELPFYGPNDKLPYLLVIILGLQHALAMVGGLVVPPLLLGGVTGANLPTEVQQYLISASLIWCSVGTVIQIQRTRLFGTRYYIGTGIVSVTGTSFAFANVALKYLQQSYQNGTCQTLPDGTKLPCEAEFGAILGTTIATGAFAIALAFVPPRIIRKLFPPLICGLMLTLIGGVLITSGVTNWAGGAGPCRNNHDINCVAGDRAHKWGSAQFLGLGLSCFVVIIICEVFGSAFMKSAAVFLGLIAGLAIAAGTGYFNRKVIKDAPGGTFLFVHRFPLAVRGQLVLPMIAAWCIIIVECIGNITASCDVSGLEIEGERFMSRIQGGILSDSITATIAGLMTVPALTTFAQNAGVIALTRNASRSSGYACAFFLLLMGIIGKFGAIFVAAPPAVIGGFTTFLFGAVTTSGLRVMAYAKWTRRDRFVVSVSAALGFSSLCVPDWFGYIFTYKGDNTGLKGFIQAITLIVQEPYLIAAVLGVFLNLVLPEEGEDEEVDNTH